MSHQQSLVCAIDELPVQVRCITELMPVPTVIRQDVTKDGRTVACYAIDSLPSIEKVAPRVLSQLPSLPQVIAALHHI